MLEKSKKIVKFINDDVCMRVYEECSLSYLL
jgi:hypothetical protein